ncbi:MAG: hypothetical protein ACP5IE_10170, partial [Infirmifilum sp.]
DIISIICTTKLSGTKGVYLATDTSAIANACANVKVGNREPVEVFRDFLLDVAEKARKRTIIVLDEFEDIGLLLGRKDPENVYNIIFQTILALRPGVLEIYPNRLTLVYLIQQVLYPSEKMKNLIVKEATTIPALGRLVATSPDGSIITKYNLQSFIAYINDALEILASKGVISKGDINSIKEAIFTKGALSRIEKYLVNMPAFISFNLLNEVLDIVINNVETNIEILLDNKLNSIPIYKIFGGSRAGVQSEHLTNAMIHIIRSLWPGEQLYPGRVMRIGYEGAYIVRETRSRDKTERNVHIFLTRFTELKYKDIDKYRREFLRLYKDILEICKEKSTKCYAYIIYPQDIDVQPILMALNNINLDGKKIELTPVAIDLTYDEMFTLLIATNEDIAVQQGI